MNGAVLFATVFLACAVEAAEALTVVLAVGTSRHWRSTLLGCGAALLVLAVVVAALGPAVGLVPLQALRLVVGALLLVFGLQWLRKAVLRASGHKALHDESAAYDGHVAAARTAGSGGRGRVQDWYAFTLSFKSVLLEGLEVAFIVITFGNNQRDVPLAALGAAAAVLVVAGIGAAVRVPLARMPENSLKFVVGVTLTSFGTFWSAEGAGAAWPGGDIALLVLVPAIALLSLCAAVTLHRIPPLPSRGTRVIPRLRAFGRFWYDFVVGDDWRVAAGVVVALGATALLVAAGLDAWWLLPAAVAVLFGLSLRRAVRPPRPGPAAPPGR
jgi:uncharacterized membrane protein